MRVLTLACAIAFMVPAAQQPPPQGRPGMVDARPSVDPNAKGTAIIRGRVFNAQTGRPLRRAMITATSDAARKSTLTDDKGQFEFKDLLAGRYQVRASLVGFVPLDFREDADSGGGQEIVLAGGEKFDRADFKLPRGGVITGRIFDEAGEPVEGLQVQALAMEYVGGMDRLTPVGSGITSKRTNDLGRFRIFGLQPGEYYVAATPGAFNTNAPTYGDMAPGYTVTYYPGTADATNTQKIKVAAAQEAEADFAIVPARTFDVSGIAFDVSGRPAAGAAVLMVPGTNVTSGLIARALTSQEGVFTFRGVASGPYTLQLQPIPAVPRPPGPTPAGARPQPMAFASSVIMVTENMSDIVLQGRPGRTAVGDIVFESGSPAMDPREIQIMPRPVDFTRSPMIGFGFQTQINKDWTFELRNLWGPRIINVSVPAGWALKAVRAGGSDVTDQPIDFDRDPGRLQIVLTGQVTEIAGNVTGEGRVAANVPVIIFSSDSSRWDFQSRFLRLVRTDENGHFSAQGLPPSDYHVVALPRVKSGTRWQRPDFLEPLARDAARTTVHEGEHVNIDLRLRSR